MQPAQPVAPTNNAGWPQQYRTGGANRYTLQNLLAVREQFLVPFHQRLYSWDTTHVDDLWKDLKWHHEAGTNDLYSLGTIETISTNVQVKSHGTEE